MLGIAVMTWLFCGSNYGQTLQAFALQKALNNIGHKNVFFQNIDSNYWCLANKPHKEPLKIKPEDLFIGDESADPCIERNRVFDIFVRKHFSLLDGYEKQDMENSMIDKNCTVVICGSDQIWNPTYHDPEYRHDSDMYAAYFEHFNGFKAISYAPSIGMEIIPDAEKEFFHDFACKINGFDAVSVREESGKKLLQEEWRKEGITEKNIEVVLDPAFLLTREDWIGAVKDDNKYIEYYPKHSGYILCYVVGEPGKYSGLVKQIARERNQKIRWIQMDDDVEVGENLEMISAVSPLEFVWEISGADYVIGDSYHAAVFSILFHKEFAILPRDYTTEWVLGDETRMIQLYSNFGIENRMIGAMDDYHKLKHIDFNSVEAQLIEKRMKSLCFLVDVLQKPADEALIKQYAEKKDFYFTFPYEEIGRNEKIIIYGAGDVGYHYYCQCKLFGYAKVILWVDRKKTEYEGVAVDSIDQDYENIQFDYILIANSNQKQREDIREFLINRMVPEEKIYSRQPILNGNK